MILGRDGLAAIIARYELPWRVGTKGEQTLYDASAKGDGGLPGRSLGRMDTPELAAFVVACVNALAEVADPGEGQR